MGLDRDMWFSRGHQGHQPHDDDDNKEEDNDKVEDNDKDKNKVEAISVLGLDVIMMKDINLHHDDKEEDNDEVEETPGLYHVPELSYPYNCCCP